MTLNKHVNQRAITLVALLFVFVLSLYWVLVRHPLEQPIEGDRAYLIYMAQAISRGEPIYQSTTFGYTPMGPLLSAGTMLGSDLFGVPSYLVPRLFAIPLIALSSVLLAIIGLYITERRIYAVWAGLLNAIFSGLIVISSSNLEPKLIVQVCTLLLIIAVQHKRWGLAGLWCGIAMMSWQPAVVIVFMPLIIGFPQWRNEGWRGGLNFIGGVILGWIPTVIYVIVTHQLNDFIIQTVYLKAIATSAIREGFKKRDWFQYIVIDNLSIHFQSVWMFLAQVGVASYISLLIRQLWKKFTEKPTQNILLKRTQPLVWLTLIWIGYSIMAFTYSLEFQGKPDFIVAQFLFSFWAFWGIFSIHQMIESGLFISRVKKAIKHPHIINRGVLLAITLGIIFMVGQPDSAYTVPYPLQDQVSNINQLIQNNTDDRLIAINTPEVYVITEDKAPWYIILFSNTFANHIEIRLQDKCDTFLNELREGLYTEIILSRRKAVCLLDIQDYIDDNTDQFEAVIEF